MAGPRVHVELGEDVSRVGLDGAPARADLEEQGVELREGLPLVLVSPVAEGCRELDAVARSEGGAWVAVADPASERVVPVGEQRRVRYPMTVLGVAALAFALWPLHLALTAHWCNWLGDAPAAGREGYCDGLAPTGVSALPSLVLAAGGLSAELLRSAIPLVLGAIAALALFVLVPFVTAG
jgi:hypothetical protein